MNPKDHRGDHKISALARWIQSTHTPQFFKINFNIIPLYTYVVKLFSSLQIFAAKILLPFLIYVNRATCLAILSCESAGEWPEKSGLDEFMQNVC
jgi:hypothetical protein